MATATYTPIASITLGSSASSVTFSSIPQDYRDLVLVVDAATSADATVNSRINGDTGSLYSRVIMFGTGATTGSSATTETVFKFSGAVNSPQLIIQFMDYSATDKHKTVLSRGNDDAALGARASRYASTDAITSVSLTPSTGTYSGGSTFALYGIAS